MIESEVDSATDTYRFVLRANASLSRAQARWLLGAMAAAMAAIGLFFAAMGAWPVLPFSGVEWLLLVLCLRFALGRSAISEVISITPDSVRVDVGRGRAGTTHRFQRIWTSVECNKPAYLGHPSRLCLRRQGRVLEIGRFLVEDERQMLARELRRILSGHEKFKNHPTSIEERAL